MKDNDDRMIYIKYRTLCPLPPELLEVEQEDEIRE